MLFTLFTLGKPTLQQRARQLVADKIRNPVRAAAINKRDLELLEEILHQRYVDLSSNVIGRGLVCELIYSCYWGAVALLLEYGWDVNREAQAESEKIFAPSLITAISSKYKPVIRLLCLYGADFNVCDPSTNIPAYRYLEPLHRGTPELKAYVHNMQIEVNQFKELKQQTDAGYQRIEPLLTNQTSRLHQEHISKLQRVQQQCQAIAQHYLDFATKDPIKTDSLEERQGQTQLTQFYRRKALMYYDKAVHCLNSLCMGQLPAEKASALETYRQCLHTLFTQVLDHQFEEPQENEQLKEQIRTLRKKLQLVTEPLAMNIPLSSSQTSGTLHQRRNNLAANHTTHHDLDSTAETTRLLL